MTLLEMSRAGSTGIALQNTELADIVKSQNPGSRSIGSITSLVITLPNVAALGTQ